MILTTDRFSISTDDEPPLMFADKIQKYLTNKTHPVNLNDLDPLSSDCESES